MRRTMTDARNELRLTISALWSTPNAARPAQGRKSRTRQVMVSWFRRFPPYAASHRRPIRADLAPAGA